MTFLATVVDPLTEPVPAGWDAFAAAHRLRPGWHSGPLRAIDWCVPIPSSMVVVEEPGGSAPVGLFHARHFGLANLARFVTPGREPSMGITECRTAPVPMDAGLTFAEGTDERDRIEAVRVFERAVRRRTGPAGAGIVYRNLLTQDLPCISPSGRLQRRLPPRMVLPNDWPDLASYLATVPGKWRSQLKKIHHAVRADRSLRVELVDTIDPAEACWLAEVIRLRYTPRTPPRPPLSAHAIAEIALLPGSRFLTYRDRDGRLLGYSACYDDGTDLQLIWWGSRSETDGWRSNLYFDQYLRLIDLMIGTGRRRLILGAGMAQIKARYGARPEQRWSVVGTAVTPDGKRSRRRAGASARRPAPTGGERQSTTHRPESGDLAGAEAPDPGRDPGRDLGLDPGRDPGREPGRGRGNLGWRRLQTWLGRSPERAGTAAECRQCGEWTSVNVLRLSNRYARYWCERCGAVVALRGRRALDVLQPVRRLRDAAALQRAFKAPAAGASGPDLREFMPPAMLRWMHIRFRKVGRSDALEKSIIYQRYREWDAHLREIGPAGAASLAAPGEPPPCPGLPPFSQVVGALHDGCYHVDKVVQRLRSATDLPLVGQQAALWERVEHARRWLARHGRSLCWVHSRRPDGGLAVPDRSQVAAALAALRAGTPPDPAIGRAARTALFGTDGGPALPTLLQTYSTKDMADALSAYLASGARPLREDALAKLTAPPAPLPASI